MYNNHTMWRKLVIPLTAALLAAAPAASAEPKICPICDQLRKEKLAYPEKAGNMLARGALNFTLGWTEMMKQPAQEAREGHHVLTGLGKGISRSASRTLGGLAEIATFWMPKVNGEYTHLSEDCPLDVEAKAEPPKPPAAKPAP